MLNIKLIDTFALNISLISIGKLFNIQRFLPSIDIEDGVVSVNGEVLQEDYVVNNDHFYGKFEVPEGKYFFLGDNRPISHDSRKWINPYIDGKYIEAKAQIKVYPFKDFGSIK